MSIEIMSIQLQSKNMIIVEGFSLNCSLFSILQKIVFNKQTNAHIIKSILFLKAQIFDLLISIFYFYTWDAVYL